MRRTERRGLLLSATCLRLYPVLAEDDGFLAPEQRRCRDARTARRRVVFSRKGVGTAKR